jgi:hypothetical protein
MLDEKQMRMQWLLQRTNAQNSGIKTMTNIHCANLFSSAHQRINTDA